jgi:hypothetical protein
MPLLFVSIRMSIMIYSQSAKQLLTIQHYKGAYVIKSLTAMLSNSNT